MVELNLLHTRMEQSNYENKMVRQYLLTALGIAMVILIGCHEWLQINNQHERQALDSLQEAQPAPANITNPNHGDGGEFTAVDVLKVLSKTAESTINGVCYTQLMRDALQVNLQGNAWSLAGISSLINQISMMDLFTELHLLNIKQQNNNDLFQFNLVAQEG